MAVDKPNINLTFAQLEQEAAKPEPFVFALPGSKRITFPDIFDLPAEEAEDFFNKFEKSKDDFSALGKWLPKADFEAYKAAKLPLRMHALLVQKVMDYYEKTVGLPGEDDASAS